MFTGIIQAVCPIRWVEDAAGTIERRIAVETPFSDLKLGESIAVNGACLTVAKSEGTVAQFHLSSETVKLTSLGALTKDRRCNLERALCVGDSLSGHWVQGHVDGLGSVKRVVPEGESYRVEIELEDKLRRYCVDKGSITIDGTSLTINQVSNDTGTILLQIIPHTWQETIFSDYQRGDLVNVEVDILAKYVEQQCSPYKKP